MKRRFPWLNHILNFLAVILGVYLAFYINELAKEREERAESILLMRSLLDDLSADISTYKEYQIPENQQHQQNIERLLGILLEERYTDIGNELSSIFQVENYSPTTSTYSSMKSSGKLRLINDLTLQKELSAYYEGLVIESIEKAEFQVDYFSNQLLPWVTENVNLIDMKLVKTDEILSLTNKLIIYESLIAQKVAAYQQILDESTLLMERIEHLLSDF